MVAIIVGVAGTVGISQLHPYNNDLADGTERRNRDRLPPSAARIDFG